MGTREGLSVAQGDASATAFTLTADRLWAPMAHMVPVRGTISSPLRRCLPLGVHSPWLPNLPHGCSYGLQMSKERTPALVLTKAELFFSVERYIHFSFIWRKLNKFEIGKWPKAIKRKACSKCSLLHLCEGRGLKDWKCWLRAVGAVWGWNTGLI